MTDNTENVSEMQPPVIEGSETQGGAPEESTTQVETPTTDKAEDTADHQTTTDDNLQSELDRLEKERKQLARTSADRGRKAKEAKLAALSAIAKLDNEKAKEFLDEYPEYKDDFSEAYPDRFTETPEVVPQDKISDKTIDKDLLKAEILAETAKASQEQEYETTSVEFAVANGLNKEEQQKLKKTAQALVSADASTSFEDALSIVYHNKYGKSPEAMQPIIPTGHASEPAKEVTEDQINFWQQQIDTRISRDQAIQIQKEADAFHKTMTKK